MNAQAAQLAAWGRQVDRPNQPSVPNNRQTPRCDWPPEGDKWRFDVLIAFVKLKERNSQFEMSVQEARDAAMLLVEQDRATIKGDVVSAL